MEAPKDYPYIRCRTRMQGHDWTDYGPVPGERKPQKGYVFAHFICDRCQMVKRYEIHLKSGQAFTKPVYFNRPKDYKLDTPMTQGEWRRAFLKAAD